MTDPRNIDSFVQEIIYSRRIETFEEILNHLQNTARTALFFFINGSFWFEDRLSILSSDTNRSVINCIAEMKPYLITLNKKQGCFFKTTDFLLHHGIRLSINEAASFFAIFYDEFERITSQLKKGTATVIQHAGFFDHSLYPIEDSDYLLPLIELKEYAINNLKEHLSGFYLHGSLATRDYIRNWSDVDTLMIIKADTILSPEKLLLCRMHAIKSQKFFYLIDPFQLHGHLVISEFDMNYYPESYFPLALFDYALSFWEDRPIRFQIRDSYNERVSAFWHDSVNYFLLNLKKFKKNKNRCSLSAREKKLFLHRIMTFPLFYLQAKGIYGYKKYSFEKAQADFNENSWKAVEAATNIMKCWSYTYEMNRALSFVANTDIEAYYWLITRYFNAREKLLDGPLSGIQVEYEKLLYSSASLAIEGWEKIEPNAD